jgi:hypothetical protein
VAVYAEVPPDQETVIAVVWPLSIGEVALIVGIVSAELAVTRSVAEDWLDGELALSVTE